MFKIKYVVRKFKTVGCKFIHIQILNSYCNKVKERKEIEKKLKFTSQLNYRIKNAGSI